LRVADRHVVNPFANGLHLLFVGGGQRVCRIPLHRDGIAQRKHPEVSHGARCEDHRRPQDVEVLVGRAGARLVARDHLHVQPEHRRQSLAQVALIVHPHIEATRAVGAGEALPKMVQRFVAARQLHDFIADHLDIEGRDLLLRGVEVPHLVARSGREAMGYDRQPLPFAERRSPRPGEQVHRRSPAHGRGDLECAVIAAMRIDPCLPRGRSTA
jgi:hypothetical protein